MIIIIVENSYSRALLRDFVYCTEFLQIRPGWWPMNFSWWNGSQYNIVHKTWPSYCENPLSFRTTIHKYVLQEKAGIFLSICLGSLHWMIFCSAEFLLIFTFCDCDTIFEYAPIFQNTEIKFFFSFEYTFFTQPF